MGIPSFKKDLIQYYSLFANSEKSGENKLMLVTAAGIIYGTLIQLNESEPKDTKDAELIAYITNQHAKEYCSKYQLSNDVSLPGGDGGIGLKDVSIKSANGTFCLPFLFVFYDQVIAATIGNI